MSESDDRTRWLQRRVRADPTDTAAVSALAEEYRRADERPGPHEHCWHEFKLPKELTAFAEADFCCAPGCKAARVVHPLAREKALRADHGDVPPHELIVVRPEMQALREDPIEEHLPDFVEVSRIGPGIELGWRGRQFDYGDGRGYVDVEFGVVGFFTHDPYLEESVQAAAGGGRYRVTSNDGGVTAFSLPGRPLPLSLEGGP
jgi:hypothetical protein